MCSAGTPEAAREAIGVANIRQMTGQLKMRSSP
ncbi:hypothetical protein MAV_3697 [Mycobacterium avium 104]|uniref:Uncharacterized protein n=1 Tax=Mycobacterium avium (strain 104) TaxID=243243 RepID=A0A0H2ZUH5_MYCA1|nr:hypothetical protein MAV_3697 [Mycobacterium avium 104]